VFAQRLSGYNEAYKVEFTINEHPTARYETYIVIGMAQRLVKERQDSQTYPTVPINYKGKKLKARIMFLKRLDKYGGICEEFAAMVNVDFKLCICHSMNAIAEYYPNEVSAIAHKIKPTLSRIANSNCENVCKTHNMECDDTYYDLLNYCSQVKNLVDEEELEVA